MLRLFKNKGISKCLGQKFLTRNRHFNNNFFNHTKELVDKKETNKTIPAKDIIYNALEQNGVKHTFIFSGGSIMPVIENFFRNCFKIQISNLYSLVRFYLKFFHPIIQQFQISLF